MNRLVQQMAISFIHNQFAKKKQFKVEVKELLEWEQDIQLKNLNFQ